MVAMLVAAEREEALAKILGKLEGRRRPRGGLQASKHDS